MKRRNFFKIAGGGIFIFFQPWSALDLLVYACTAGTKPDERLQRLPADR